jgi:hypothetical protein
VVFEDVAVKQAFPYLLTPLVPFITRPEYSTDDACLRPPAQSANRNRGMISASATLAGVCKRPSHGVLWLYDACGPATATNTGFASPGCAAPPGFLDLLTRYSVPDLPALFHAGNALELLPPEDSPFR